MREARVGSSVWQSTLLGRDKLLQQPGTWKLSAAQTQDTAAFREVPAASMNTWRTCASAPEASTGSPASRAARSRAFQRCMLASSRSPRLAPAGSIARCSSDQTIGYRRPASSGSTGVTRVQRVAATTTVATRRSTAMRVAELMGAQRVAMDMDVTVLRVLHDFVEGPG